MTAFLVLKCTINIIYTPFFKKQRPEIQVKPTQETYEDKVQAYPMKIHTFVYFALLSAYHHFLGVVCGL